METAAIRRTESHFGEPGRELFRRAWLPADPELAVVLVHGYGEHSGRYEHLGSWFAERACAIHAFDLRGHGRSSGKRGHVRRFSELLDDLEGVIEIVRGVDPTLPLFALGHSVGGLLLASLATQRQPDLSGAVLSGAALSFPKPIPPAKRWAARAARLVAPWLSLDGGVDPNRLSTNPEVGRAYLADPWVHGRMTLSFACELMKAMDETRDAGSQVELPLLVLHGEKDRMCACEGSRRFAESAADASFHAYPGLFHEIFNEPGYGSIFEEILSWLRERVPQPLKRASQLGG